MYPEKCSDVNTFSYAAGSPDTQGTYLHYAPRTEEERREQRKAARLALVRALFQGADIAFQQREHVSYERISTSAPCCWFEATFCHAA